MMTNLFSVFDPSSSIMNFSFNWMSTFIGFLLIPSMYWIFPSRYSIMWNNLTMTLHKEFKILLGKTPPLGMTILFISLFSMILFNNLLGLFPYIFTSTSHLTLSLTLSLPLWISFMLFGWINHSQHMFSHLVPQGTPGVLMPFMVCIETISNIIRSGTLAIRLTANMISGHLLLTLLGNSGVMTNYIMISLIISTQILLMLLETAVAMIQSYVFSTLTTLYSSEVN
nr:ATP synthase F0 subunit 6 [Domodon peperpotensis]